MTRPLKDSYPRFYKFFYPTGRQTAALKITAALKWTKHTEYLSPSAIYTQYALCFLSCGLYAAAAVSQGLAKLGMARKE